MYRIFTESVNNFFLINQEGENHDEYRLRIAQPIKGLADINLYTQWKKENSYYFHETNNLVYEINQSSEKIHSFKTLARDLWAYGYDAIKNNSFSTDVINEQLKLIRLLASRKYWVEL